MLFLAETHYDIELLQEELLDLFEREADKEAASLLLNWFRQLAAAGRVAPEDDAALEHVYRDTEEARTMLVKTFDDPHALKTLLDTLLLTPTLDAFMSQLLNA